MLTLFHSIGETLQWHPRIWVCCMHWLEHGLSSLKLPMTVTTESMCKCLVLAMGPCPFTNIFQSWMVFIFEQMESHWWPKPYIHDIFCGKGETFDKYLEVLDEIFTSLNTMAFKRFSTRLNSLFSSWLYRFSLEETGYKPTGKRIKAILNLIPPKMSNKSKLLEQYISSSSTFPIKQPSWNHSLTWPKSTNSRFGNKKCINLLRRSLQQLQIPLFASTLIQTSHSIYTLMPHSCMH